MANPEQIRGLLVGVESALESSDAHALRSALGSAHASIKSLPAGDPEAGDLLADLGRLLHHAGEHESAIKELRDALPLQIARHGEATWQVARTRRLIAASLICLHDVPSAILELESAARIACDSDYARVEVACSSWLLGNLLVRIGRAAEALAPLRRVLMSLESVQEFDELRARAEDYLGTAFLQLGRLDAAEYRLEAAVQRHRGESGENSLEYADWLLELAQLYDLQQRFAYAVECAQRCVAIRTRHLPQDDPQLATAHLVLACLLSECEEWAKARPHYYAAMQIMQGAGLPDPAHFFVAHAGFLHTEVKMGATEGTEEDLQKVLAISCQLREDSEGGITQALVDLALLKEARGDPVASHALAERAQRAASESRNDHLNRPAFLDLARLQVKHGAPASAVSLLDWVATIDAQLASRLVDTCHFSQRVLYSDTLAEATSELISTVREHLSGNEEAVRIALRVVLARKGLLTEADIANNRRMLELRGRGVDEQLDRVEALRRELRDLEMHGPTDGFKKLWHTVDKKKRELREQESLLAGAIDDPPPASSVFDGDPARLARNLHPDEVLIEFFAIRGQERTRRLERVEPDLQSEIVPVGYVAFVFRGATAGVRLVDLGSAEPLERLVYSWIAAMHPSGVEEVPRSWHGSLEAGGESAIGARLREKVFDPIQPHVPPKSRLRIAPDGALAAVSFALLPLADGTRLIDRFEVSYVSCGRALLHRGTPREHSSGDPLIFVDPDFDGGDLSTLLARSARTPDFYFRRLSRSADEGRRVQWRIGGSPMTQGQATKAALVAVRSPPILHVATHAYFLPKYTAHGRSTRVIGEWRKEGFGLWLRGDVLALVDEPLLRSGLVLAGVNAYSAGLDVVPEMGDGLLTALEISRLDLRGTELAVLSACSTARGAVRPGEGSAGLLQSFEAAGARSVVAALWAVAEHPATLTLIDTFYSELLRGSTKPAALRRAQRRLKQLGAPGWVWGSLVCYGDPDALQWRPGQQA